MLVKPEEYAELYDRDGFIFPVDIISGNTATEILADLEAAEAELADDPEKINQDPYGDGWIVRINASDFDEGDLMTPDAYQELLDQLDD